MNISFGEKLKKSRKEYGMTQGQLASAVGVTQGAISHLEKGLNQPTVEIASKISTVLKVSVAWLLSGKDENGVANLSRISSPDLTVDIASQAMAALDAFLGQRKMNPSPKMKRKLYEGLIEEYLDQEQQVDMVDILNEMAGEL